MNEFAELFAALDETTSTNDKVKSMVRYFSNCAPADSAWAIYFLCGRKPRQVVKTSELRNWAQQLASIPDWLFQESYDAVGDLAETVALLLPATTVTSYRPLTEWVEQRLLPLREMTEQERQESVISSWEQLDSRQRFIWNKLITGGFRVGVSQLLVVRALAQVSNQPATTISHRLMGDWQPTSEFYSLLIAVEHQSDNIGRPYPFFLASPVEGEPSALGNAGEWLAEWKWDGIRAQLLRRDGQTFLWTRGEELVTERYPEVVAAASQLPATIVLDGELLPWRDGRVMPFAELQKRIGRKTLGKKLLADVPVALMAYDLIEYDGADWREQPLFKRREQLEHVIADAESDSFRISPIIRFSDWDELAAQRRESRSKQVEGIMLKRLDSPYRVGRVRGDWWKWKIEPFTMDAVLTAAQRGNGRRASLYTDYTFSVWNEGELVTIAKAYSGLTDAEIRVVDAFVRANTLEKFGPVRTVKPELVFELGFEGIQASNRHKSGVAVRFPRILRQRTDKSATEADTLQQVKRLLLLPGAES